MRGETPSESRQHNLIAPIFPLPNVVFFPHTYLPLYIFEPRYRAMVAAALEGERLIAMVLARRDSPPGEPPDAHSIGSVGRIELTEKLPDGCYNIVLEGISRVVVGRPIPRPGNYYAAGLEPLGDALPDLQDPEVAEAKARFMLAARRYVEQVLGGEYPNDLLSDALPYATLVNRTATLLQIGVDTKQSLLRLDDVEERAERVEALLVDQTSAQSAIKLFKGHRPDEPRVN